MKQRTLSFSEAELAALRVRVEAAYDAMETPADNALWLSILNKVEAACDGLAWDIPGVPQALAMPTTSPTYQAAWELWKWLERARIDRSDPAMREAEEAWLRIRGEWARGERDE